MITSKRIEKFVAGTPEAAQAILTGGLYLLLTLISKGDTYGIFSNILAIVATALQFSAIGFYTSLTQSLIKSKSKEGNSQEAEKEDMHISILILPLLLVGSAVSAYWGFSIMSNSILTRAALTAVSILIILDINICSIADSWLTAQQRYLPIFLSTNCAATARILIILGYYIFTRDDIGLRFLIGTYTISACISLSYSWSILTKSGDHSFTARIDNIAELPKTFNDYIRQIKNNFRARKDDIRSAFLCSIDNLLTPMPLLVIASFLSTNDITIWANMFMFSTFVGIPFVSYFSRAIVNKPDMPSFSTIRKKMIASRSRTRKYIFGAILFLAVMFFFFNASNIFPNLQNLYEKLGINPSLSIYFSMIGLLLVASKVMKQIYYRPDQSKYGFAIVLLPTILFGSFVYANSSNLTVSYIAFSYMLTLLVHILISLVIYPWSSSKLKKTEQRCY